MSQRANARMEHMTAAVNLRSQEAIKVDGVPFILWQRTPSSEAGISGRTCSCHGSKQSLPASFLPIVVTHDETGSVIEDIVDDAVVVDNDQDDYRIVGITSNTAKGRRDLTNQIAKTTQTTRTNINTPVDDETWGTEDEGQDFDSAHKFAVDDNQHDAMRDFETLEQFLGGSDSLAEGGGFGNSISTAGSANCPVCAGATYVEAWQPYGGRRTVFSFLESDTWDSDGELLTNTHPYVLSLKEGQTLNFTLKLPYLFTDVIRVGAWNSRTPIENSDEAPRLVVGGGTTEATPAAILATSGFGDPLRFRLVAPRDMLLTHFDIVVMLRDLPRAQFAPLNAPYEAELLEYMTNMQIECSADVYAAPGDVISDYKFRKMWRITNSAQRFTSGGASMSSQLDISVLTSYSPQFSLHPFTTPRAQGDNRFAGINQSLQGNGDFKR